MPYTEHNIEDRELLVEVIAERNVVAMTGAKLLEEALDQLQGRITHVSNRAVGSQLFPNGAKPYIQRAMEREVTTDTIAAETTRAMAVGDALGGLHNNDPEEIMARTDAMLEDTPDIDQIRETIDHLDFEPTQSLDNDFPMEIQ